MKNVQKNNRPILQYEQYHDSKTMQVDPIDPRKGQQERDKITQKTTPNQTIKQRETPKLLLITGKIV